MGGEREHIDGFGPTAPHASGDAPTDAATGSLARGDEPDGLIGGVLADRYRIERRLGSGGMGAVYAGTHLLLAKPVAVKVIKPRLGGDRNITQRFVQEARAASGIDHPHVVHITDFGETADGTAFLVMEFLEGEDLAETVQREGPLAWQRVAHIGEQIARALAAAHKQGIVHRDIKPANCCRLTRDEDPDFVKVLDFGLAKVMGPAREGDRSLTQTGALLGTPGYIAPELYRGLPTDHRVDLYALGALMYKLLTGELPPMRFGSDDPSGVNLPPAPLGCQAIVRKALAEDPSARYATAQALAADLKSVVINPDAAPLFGLGGSGSAPQPVDPPSGPRIDLREPSTTSNPKLLAVMREGHRVHVSVAAPLLAFLVVGGAIALYLLWTAKETEPVVDATPAVEPVAGDSTNPAGRPVTPGRRAQPGDDDRRARGLGASRPRPAVDEATTGADATTGPAEPDGTEGHVPEATPPEPSADPPEPPPPVSPPEPEPAPQSRPGTPEALQRQIYRDCPSSFRYTVDAQWKADDQGRVVRSSVRGKSSQGELNDAQQCALRVIKRSALSWQPGRKYKETFEIVSK